jgi:hypothetical protein
MEDTSKVASLIQNKSHSAKKPTKPASKILEMMLRKEVK